MPILPSNKELSLLAQRHIPGHKSCLLCDVSSHYINRGSLFFLSTLMISKKRWYYFKKCPIRIMFEWKKKKNETVVQLSIRVLGFNVTASNYWPTVTPHRSGPFVICLHGGVRIELKSKRLLRSGTNRHQTVSKFYPLRHSLPSWNLPKKNHKLVFITFLAFACASYQTQPKDSAQGNTLSQDCWARLNKQRKPAAGMTTLQLS